MQQMEKIDEEHRCKMANQYYHDGDIGSILKMLDIEHINKMPKALHNYAYFCYADNVLDEKSESVMVEKVINMLEMAIQLDYQNSKSYALLGKIYYDTKQYQKALNMFKKALSLTDNCADYNYISMILFEQKEYDLCEEYLMKALCIQEHPLILYNLALTLAVNHKHEESMNYLKRIEICDDIWSFDLARIYFILGDYKEACDFYRTEWSTLSPNEIDFGAFLYSLKVEDKLEEYDQVKMLTLDIVNDHLSEYEDKDAIELEMKLRDNLIEIEKNIKSGLKPEIYFNLSELQRCYLYYCLFHTDSDVF